MAAEELIVRFPAVDLNIANQHVEDLRSELKQMGVQDVERRREQAESQDFGATLVLVLGTASVTAIAKGLGAWLRRTGTKVEITKPDGTRTVISNTDSADIAKIIEAMSHAH
jgi:hypothetical protein